VNRRILAAALAVVLGIATASCAGEDQTGTASHRMAKWVSGTGLGEDIGTLVADNARIPKETSTGGMHAACGTMEDDADTANDELPSPDSVVTEWLSNAYGLEGTAATDCYNAGVTNKKLLATAERDATKANVLYTRTLIRIQSIDGRVPTTTTTTNNAPISVFG
jgi:hypothetical protein